jgi:chemotaxis protein MotA
MNLVTLGGLLLAWGALMAAIILDGASLSSFMKLAPAILVFGGTTGATVISFSMDQLKSLPAKTKRAFFTPKFDYHKIIETLVGFATKSRRDGVLALEDSIEAIEDDFMKKGLQMLVDGVDMDRLRETLEQDIASLKLWYKEGEEFWKQMGGFGPTLGIIGTVLGLIQMLSELEDAESMGPAIASAFIATMYGVSAANLLFLPVGNKIKTVGNADLLGKKMILQGLICMQAGISPRMTEQTLLSFLYPESKTTGEGKAGKREKQE